MRYRHRKDSAPRQTGPLRRIVAVDETGFHVVFRLECGHSSLMYPYRFKDHKPYPKRRRCFARCGLEDA